MGDLEKRLLEERLQKEKDDRLRKESAQHKLNCIHSAIYSIQNYPEYSSFRGKLNAGNTAFLLDVSSRRTASRRVKESNNALLKSISESIYYRKGSTQVNLLTQDKRLSFSQSIRFESTINEFIKYHETKYLILSDPYDAKRYMLLRPGEYSVRQQLIGGTRLITFERKELKQERIQPNIVFSPLFSG